MIVAICRVFPAVTPAEAWGMPFGWVMEAIDLATPRASGEGPSGRDRKESPFASIEDLYRAAGVDLRV